MKLDNWMPQALGGVRIMTSLLFIEHGTQKLLGFPTPAHGVVPLLSLMGFGGCLEAIGGILRLVGLKTRIVAFVLSGEMLHTSWHTHPAASSPFLTTAMLRFSFALSFCSSCSLAREPGASTVLSVWIQPSADERSAHDRRRGMRLDRTSNTEPLRREDHAIVGAGLGDQV